ncbi:MAG: hypothetical protein IKP68_03425 [Clostridia bacterium]|nr:hypothetical protein [Clostridia bacterium]
MKTLNEFKDKISKTETQEKFGDIAYEAFLQDDRALQSKNSLYEKVVKLCIKREVELGLL